MKDRAVVFRYKRGKSVLHRLPASVKLALTLCASFSVMALPLPAVCAAIALMAALAFTSGFTLREQCADIKPACYYALFLIVINIAAGLSSGGTTGRDWQGIVIPRADYILYMARLCLVMQISALLFRTTTTIEIKETVCMIETGIRMMIKRLPLTRNLARNLSPDAKFGKNAALMLSFIPALFDLWEKLNRAYRARGGRGGLKKYRVLLIALFSLSFHHASEKAKALAARESG
jgi:biotin transport system permease protein/energy-coupling factor transport system permease protein